MFILVAAAVTGIGASAYGVYNQVRAGQSRVQAAQVDVQRNVILTEAAEYRVGTSRLLVDAAQNRELASMNDQAAALLMIDSAGLKVKAAENAVIATQIKQRAIGVQKEAAIWVGEATAQGHEFQAGVAKYNAGVQMQNADYTRFQGEVLARREGMEGRFRIGQAKAIQSASGLDVNRGSTVQVRESMAGVARENMAQIRTNAGKAAFGQEAEAANFLAQSQLDLLSAKNARTSAAYTAKGLDFALEGAQLEEGGARLGVEGAKLGVEGARRGFLGTVLASEGAKLETAGARRGVTASEIAVRGARLGITGAELGVEGARVGATGSIVGGVGTVAARWMDMNRTGMDTRISNFFGGGNTDSYGTTLSGNTGGSYW